MRCSARPTIPDGRLKWGSSDFLDALAGASGEEGDTAKASALRTIKQVRYIPRSAVERNRVGREEQCRTVMELLHFLSYGVNPVFRGKECFHDDLLVIDKMLIALNHVWAWSYKLMHFYLIPLYKVENLRLFN